LRVRRIFEKNIIATQKTILSAKMSKLALMTRYSCEHIRQMLIIKIKIITLFTHIFQANLFPKINFYDNLNISYKQGKKKKKKVYIICKLKE
jgi:hypothetical protein